MLWSGCHDHRLYIERLLIAAAIGLALLFIWNIRDVLMLVFGAVVVAVLLRAIADPIAHVLPVGDRGAVALTVLLVALAAGFFAWLLGGQLRGEFAGLWRSLPATLAALQERLTALPASDRILSAMRDADPDANVVARVGNLLLTLGGALADFILILFGAIFIAAQPGLYKTGLLKLVPRAGRALAGDALDDSGRHRHRTSHPTTIGFASARADHLRSGRRRPVVRVPRPDLRRSAARRRVCDGQEVVCAQGARHVDADPRCAVPVKTGNTH